MLGKKTLFLILEFRLELELELGLNLECLEGVSKTLGALVYLYCSPRGGFAPGISTVRITQAAPKF